MLSDNKLIDADRIKSLKIDINRLLKEEINSGPYVKSLNVN